MIADDIEHEKIILKVEGIKANQEASFFMMNLTLEHIQKDVLETLEQTKRTNGRVTQLEIDYEIIRVLKKHKWLFGILMVGLFKVYEIIDINWIFNKLITLF